MTVVFESRLAKLTVEKIDKEDERARDLMADGMLQNFGEYRHASGYRRALADAKKLLNETLEELLKE